jgi:parallel beta-helix repeat protein
MSKKQSNTHIIHVFMIIGLLITITMFSGCNQQQQLPVRIQGSSERFETITDALQASTDGDVIFCNQGVFEESILINTSITLIGADQNKTVINAGWTGDGITIQSDMVTISNLTIIQAGNFTYPEVDAGIDVQGDLVTIEHVTITGSNYGVYLYRKNNITIHNCHMYDNTQRGIYMNTADRIQITDCVVDNTTFGIYWNGVINSLIENCQIRNHDEAGVYLGAESTNDTVSRNTINENNFGVHLKGSTKNNLTENLFLSNTRGLYLCCGGKDNLIYTNVFLSNIEHAYGYPVNRFDNGSIGNYWDDYTGVDENNDGIGDTPYNATISDTYGVSNIDYFPLMSPKTIQ